MVYSIDRSILDSIEHCDRKNCQKKGWKPCGCGLRLISNDLLEVENGHKCLPLCQYRLSFASNIYCNCPARIEIFKKHDV